MTFDLFDKKETFAQSAARFFGFIFWRPKPVYWLQKFPEYDSGKHENLITFPLSNNNKVSSNYRGSFSKTWFSVTKRLVRQAWNAHFPEQQFKNFWQLLKIS